MFEFQSHLKPGKLVAGAYNRPRQTENDQLLFLLRNRYPCYWELPTTYAHEAHRVHLYTYIIRIVCRHLEGSVVCAA